MLILGMNKRERVIIKFNRNELVEILNKCETRDEIADALEEFELEVFLKPEIFFTYSMVKAVFSGAKLFRIFRRNVTGTSSGR